VWSLCRYPTGQRLVPMLRTLVTMLRRDGDLVLSDEDIALLSAMSTAAMDRHLKSEPVRLGLKGRSHTKPGMLLQFQVPFPLSAEVRGPAEFRRVSNLDLRCAICEALSRATSRATAGDQSSVGEYQRCIRVLAQTAQRALDDGWRPRQLIDLCC
jgi:hypothetical protein